MEFLCLGLFNQDSYFWLVYGISFSIFVISGKSIIVCVCESERECKRMFYCDQLVGEGIIGQPALVIAVSYGIYIWAL